MYYCHACWQLPTTMITAPAWSKHAMSLEPSLNDTILQQKFRSGQVNNPRLTNLRSGVPYIFCRGGKVRLIQLLDYLSVASPESGLFSDWSRNKKVLRTEPWLVTFVAVWFPVKKFPRADEFHHDVWWGEWREPFLAALNAQNSQRRTNRMHL